MRVYRWRDTCRSHANVAGCGQVELDRKGWQVVMHWSLPCRGTDMWSGRRQGRGMLSVADAEDTPGLVAERGGLLAADGSGISGVDLVGK